MLVVRDIKMCLRILLFLWSKKLNLCNAVYCWTGLEGLDLLLLPQLLPPPSSIHLPTFLNQCNSLQLLQHKTLHFSPDSSPSDLFENKACSNKRLKFNVLALNFKGLPDQVFRDSLTSFFIQTSSSSFTVLQLRFTVCTLNIINASCPRVFILLLSMLWDNLSSKHL